jgi:DNA-binding response OmpR family regulator
VAEADKKIVYIEDETEMVDLVRLALGLKGLEVIGAWNGRDGLETVQQVKPDLVLLDLMLPDMDGWEVYDKMRADYELRGIPVIVVTAKAMPMDRLVGLHVRNADGYITKPFNVQELVESVNRMLGNRGADPAIQSELND